MLSNHFCRTPSDAVAAPGDPLLNYKSSTYDSRLIKSGPSTEASKRLGWKFTSIVARAMKSLLNI